MDKRISSMELKLSMRSSGVVDCRMDPSIKI